MTPEVLRQGVPLKAKDQYLFSIIYIYLFTEFYTSFIKLAEAMCVLYQSLPPPHRSLLLFVQGRGGKLLAHRKTTRAGHWVELMVWRNGAAYRRVTSRGANRRLFSKHGFSVFAGKRKTMNAHRQANSGVTGGFAECS